MAKDPMTPTTLAETILKDVPRYRLNGYDAATEPAKKGGIVFLSDILAALTAAMDPAIAERAGEVVEAAAKAQEWMRYPDDAESISLTGLAEWVNRRPASVIPALASVAQSLLAQNAALRAEVRKSAMDAVSAGCQAQEAWEAQKAALDEVEALRAEVEWWKQDDRAAWDKCEERRIAQEAAEAVAEKLRGAAQSDADLLFDAYKGLLVLRKMLDVAGLKAGVEAADSLIERMETTHPEMPGRSALRAALTTEAGE